MNTKMHLFFMAAIALPILAGPALAGPPSLMLSTDFSSLPPGTVVQGSAGLSGGYLQLTPATGSQQGAWYWDPGQVLTTFHLKCDIYMGNGSSPPADGMAFCYGPLNWSSSFGEYGYGNGLRVCMPTYNTNRLIVYYGATTVADIALSSAILVNSRWTQFAIDIDANGTCYVSHDRNLYVYHTISGWNPQAGWTVGVGGRTGGAWELNAIDNLTISKSEPFAVSMTRASANPVVVGASSIDYTTLFNETVFNLGTADFNLTTTGSASAAVASVIGPNFAVNESFASGPGAGTLVGSALITSGELHLTEAVNGQTGRWYLAPRRMAGFYSQFDLYIGGGNGADGFLFAYGPDATSSGIDGPATGLAVSFDTYDNGGEGTPNIVIKHANVERHITSRALRTGSWVPVRINVTTEGLCTVWWNGARCGADVPLPGWNPQTNWFVALSGFTGGLNDRHWVDNFQIYDNSYTVRLNTLSGAGTVRLNLNNATVNDFAGSNIAPATQAADETYTFDLVPPTVSAVAVQSGLTVDVTFSEAMGSGVTTAANYALSGTGKGTLATNPDSVALVSGNTYRLTWNTGEMKNGGNVTIAVSNVQDSVGNTIGSPNSGTHSGGGIGTAPNATAVTPTTPSPTSGSTVSFSVAFDEAVQNFDAATDVTVNTTGTVAYVGTSISGVGQNYTVDLTGISGDGTLTLAVNTSSDVADLGATDWLQARRAAR